MMVVYKITYPNGKMLWADRASTRRSTSTAGL